MNNSRRTTSIHGLPHITPAGHSVFYDLFPTDEAAELEMRSLLLMGLEEWLAANKLTHAQAAKVLGVTRSRVADIKRGEIIRFNLDQLVRLAARAGLRPELRLAA